MRMRSGLLVAIIGPLLLAATPVLAQDETTHVAYGPIGFDVPAALGVSVNLASVPETAPDDPAVYPYPPRLMATVYGEREVGKRAPQVGGGSTVITVFRVADAEGKPAVATQVAALQAILETRPDLAASTTNDPLPFLPVTVAYQQLRARPAYVDTPFVSGISYLTAFEQAGEGGPLDSFPLTSTSLLATFQGLSTDGEWYVSVVQDLETSLLPDEPSPRDIRSAGRDWDGYLADTVASIQAGSPSDFTPSLDAVDALVSSITIPGESAPEPSPSGDARPAPGG